MAKGILRNVGKYEREGQEYYFPNYPYNDLRQDPFLLEKSNAFTIPLASRSTSSVCRQFTVFATAAGTITYIDCYSGEAVEKNIGDSGDFPLNTSFDLCALDFPSPTFGGGAEGAIISNTYSWYKLTVAASDSATFNYYPPVPAQGSCGVDALAGSILPPPSGANWAEYCALNASNGCCTSPTALQQTTVQLDGSVSTIKIVPSLSPPTYESGDGGYSIELLEGVGYGLCAPAQLDAFDEEGSKYRHVFNSPETSFGQPFLGNVLKLENVIFGAGRAHFTQVRANAMYRLVSIEAQNDALPE